MKRLLLFLGITIAVSVANGVLAKITRQDKKINISVTVQETDLILKALAEMPLKESGNLYMSIQAQAQAQLQQQKPVQKIDSTKKKS
jgi:predicted secreted hydrolase